MYRNCNCKQNNYYSTNSNNDYCEEEDNCACGYDSSDIFGSNYMYGHAYVKNQVMTDVYCPQTALQNGTMFPELNMPYYPNQSLEVLNFLRESNEIKEGCNS